MTATLSLGLEVPTPNYKAFGTKYKMPIPQSAYLDIDVTANVNYDRSIDESTYDDNVITGKVRVYWSKTMLLPKTK